MENIVSEKILKEGTSSMKVVVDGGNTILSDSTVPFCIGFDKSISDNNPTKILVIDVTGNQFQTINYLKDIGKDFISERTFFDLEPINYLQLKRPGIHHLIFVLFNYCSKDYRREFLQTTRSGSYKCGVDYINIESNEFCHQLCYTEVVVSVPDEYFAPEPKTKFQTMIFKWVNSWYKSEPIDECEYRKRKFWAFTTKPILWFFGFIPRIICSIVMTIVMFIVRIVCLVFGFQPVSFFPNLKMVFVDFLFKYPISDYEEVFSFSSRWFNNSYFDKKKLCFYDYKTIWLGRKKVHTPVTLFGLIYYSALFFSYTACLIGFFSLNVSLPASIFLLFFQAVVSLIISISMVGVTLPTLINSQKWELKWDNTNNKKEVEKFQKKIAKIIFFSMSGVATACFIYTKVNWKYFREINFFDFSLSFFSFIGGILLVIFVIITIVGVCVLIKNIIDFFRFTPNEIKTFTSKIVVQRKNKKIREKKSWLENSFDMSKIPEKVDFKVVPPYSSYLHSLKITFWRTKAKVCRPFAQK